MRKFSLILASAFVAASASAAFAMPGPMYPGDHLSDYDPINQAYEWRLNNDGGSTVQLGRAAYASARPTSNRAVTTSQDATDPWTKARTEDSNEARGD